MPSKRRLTKGQRELVQRLRDTHTTIRRRGAFGDVWAADTSRKFAASITIDQLIRDGWLRPAKGWGEYEYNPDGPGK